MSKYVKLEDIEAVLADKHMNRPLDSDRWVIGDIGKSIADLPTTDIVKCKDCKNKYVTGTTTKYYVCDFMDAQFDENGYCHHGERIDNE